MNKPGLKSYFKIIVYEHMTLICLVYDLTTGKSEAVIKTFTLI